MSPVTLTSTSRINTFLPAIFGVLVVVFVTHFAGIVVRTVPMQPGDPRWRLASGAVLLGATPETVFILMGMAMAALMGGYFAAARWTAIASLIFGGFLLALLPFFALDFLSQRRLQRMDVLPVFTRDGLHLVAVSGLLGLSLVWAGMRGIRATRQLVSRGRRSRDEMLFSRKDVQDGARSADETSQ